MERNLLAGVAAAVLVGIFVSALQHTAYEKSDREIDVSSGAVESESRPAAGDSDMAGSAAESTARESVSHERQWEEEARSGEDEYISQPLAPAPALGKPGGVTWAGQGGDAYSNSMSPVQTAADGAAIPSSDGSDELASPVPPEWPPTALIVDSGGGSVIFAEPTGPFSEFASTPPYGQARSDFFELRDLMLMTLSAPPIAESSSQSYRYRILLVSRQCELLWVGFSAGRLSVDDHIWAMDAVTEATVIEKVEASARSGTSGEHWLDWWSGVIAEDPSDCSHFGPNGRP